MATHPYARLKFRTVDPTVNEDAPSYEIGDIWINTTSGEPFICVDDTDAAAVWVSLLGGGGPVSWGDIIGDLADQLDLIGEFTTLNTILESHTDNLSNPHETTAAQVGSPAHTDSTAANDFLLGSGSNSWIKKTLTETVTILRTILDTIFSPLDGWFAVTETWTRTGNFTFTLVGDKTAKYRKRAKVRYRDGGGVDEYGVIIVSSHAAGTTTITLAPNNDYAIAAATITDTYLCYTENAPGFPEFFNFSINNIASNTGTVTLNSTTVNKFKPLSNGLVEVVSQWNATITVAAPNQIVWDTPIPVLDGLAYPAIAATLDTTASTVTALGVFNGNSVLGAGHRIQIRKADFTNWSVAAGKIFQVRGSYPY